ncbi:hypothetical protein PZA11_005198 [Diplocarpon coronariae]|uniref:Nuclease S1 n=1 Tax=Diplocarpon coronariae TaxID=2795749 RepID=A0A218YTE4_9HELO|nr:hypothetical protein B2J93_8915 [Marssonina coronariae]
MKAQFSAAALLVASILPLCSAWGSLGHTTVAYVATNFVTDATKTYFQNVLNDTKENYLAGVATWADSYRYTHEGAFSGLYHYMDAIDSPPSSCGVDIARDCHDGCIVSAIGNYTARVQNKTLSLAERKIAAKFLIHFTGDVHQPLHVENLEVGGNDIAVLFNDVSTNLHAAWDTKIPEKLVGRYTPALAESWASNLTALIKDGSYTSESHSWLAGTSLSDPAETALSWASETNSFVCTTVLPDGQDAVEGKEISGAYYESAIPVVEKQIAKAGYRLAAWLNLIASSST